MIVENYLVQIENYGEHEVVVPLLGILLENFKDFREDNQLSRVFVIIRRNVNYFNRENSHF